MRKIILVTTNNCPRCGYIKRTVFEPVKEKCPEQAFTINGSAAPDFVKRYDVKGAPSILFLEDDERAGIAYKTFDADSIIRWLQGGRYHG